MRAASRTSTSGRHAPLALSAGDLALFVLNVGDGDSLVLRFPDDGAGPGYGVVDSFDGPKTIRLLEDLGATSLRFVCATHPHQDHIKGLREVLRHFDGNVGEFWDSGFRFTSQTYHRLILEVERQRIRFLRPTSGFEAFLGGARVTVLSPSIYLRNRYDTYGVDVNNASVVLRVSYPERAPSTDYPEPGPAIVPTPPPPDGEAGPVSGAPPVPPDGEAGPLTRALILGGDAQTDAWGRVLDEFPHFQKDDGNWARQIGVRTGRQPLLCDLLKVSHHGSKRGVNLELVERFGDSTGAGPSDGPRAMVISSDTGAGSDHGFPHAVTQALLREVRDPQARSGGVHESDGDLGIHCTANELDPGGGPAGSIAFTVSSTGKRRLYRMGDAKADPVDMSNARRDLKIR